MRYLLFIILTCLFNLSFFGQAQVEIPAPSPSAAVMQTVGVTEISVHYSSPGVKGRKVWGSLEKWGVAWRAGANAATKIKFSTDVKVAGKVLKAGTYQLFITPMEKEDWKVHFNTGASVFEYQKNGVINMDALMKKDMAMASVNPEWTKELQERLKYHVKIVGDNTAELSMRWEKVNLKLPIQLMPPQDSTKPKPSPDASTSQTVGITNFQISYSSPGVKGREIWGKLVKWDTPWRAGANAPTKITFNKDVTIDGKSVKAGAYNIFITPTEKGKWKVHLNTGGGVYAYQKDGVYDMDALMKNDAVTILLDPVMEKTSQERLKYHFNIIDDNTAEVSMKWEKINVKFPITLNTLKITAEGIEETLTEYWYSYANSAKYYLDNNLDVEKAMAWSEVSLILQPNHFFNKWVMAMALQKQGNKKEAVKYAKAAQEFGMKNPSNFYNVYKKTIADGISTMSN